MKRQAIGLLALAGLCLALPATSQDDSAAERKRRVEASRKAAIPGPEHERLMALAGSWDLDIKMWHAHGQKPMTMKARCTNTAILGGRFLRSLSVGSMPVGGGQSMRIESLSMLGFDRRHKRYTTVGFDTMGTYYITGAGPYDPKTKTITLSGEDDDPIMGFVQRYDITLRFVDRDTYVSEVFFKNKEHTQGKGPLKIVEITHRRRARK